MHRETFHNRYTRIYYVLIINVGIVFFFKSRETVTEKGMSSFTRKLLPIKYEIAAC